MGKILDRRKQRLRIQKLTIMALVILISSPMLAIAATDNYTFTPNFKDGLNDMPKEVRETGQRIVNWLMDLFILVVIVYTLYQGISAVVDGNRGDAHGRAGHITNVFIGFFVLIIVGVAIIMINYVNGGL